MTAAGNDAILFTTPSGERGLYVGPSISDDQPQSVREGLARRRLCFTTGQCPCGATAIWPNRAERRAARKAGAATRMRFEHEDDCPASDEKILAAMRGTS